MKTLEPVKNNELNNVDIDVTNIELQEWNKILNRLENMLKAEVDENKADDIRKDIERAKKAIADIAERSKFTTKK